VVRAAVVRQRRRVEVEGSTVSQELVQLAERISQHMKTEQAKAQSGDWGLEGDYVEKLAGECLVF
jgi:hypothetical protein